MYKVLTLTIALAALNVGAAVSHAQPLDCNNLPPPDQSKNFLQNFLHPCYAVRLYLTSSTGNHMGDLDQAYSIFFYRVDPRYELIMVGEFPRGRYLSITATDGHHSPSATIYDSDITPLVPQYVNPFTPGTIHKEDQLYAVAMQFGGSEPDTIQPGCGFGNLRLHANILDASKRHQGISWNGTPGLPPWFPIHDDVGPNTGGMVTVRQYLPEEDGGAFRLVTPVLIARDLSTGCAVPAQQVVARTPEEVTPEHLVAFREEIAYDWVSPEQIRAHQIVRSMQVPKCYTFTPASALWLATTEYIESPNPDAGYILGVLPKPHVAWLVENKGFLRVRFRLPAMPSIPCSGCSLTGSEELRYLSLSFYDSQNRTLASIGDFELAKNPNGYVTVIAGFGSSPPSQVTPENYYTYFDLAAVSGYEDLTLLGLRTIIPAETFPCSAKEVPVYSTADNSLGGFMGEYTPVVDVVRGVDIPPIAEPLQRPNNCGVTPPEPPGACPF